MSREKSLQSQIDGMRERMDLHVTQDVREAEWLTNQITDLQQQVAALTEAVKDADTRLMPDQNAIEKHLRAVDGLVDRLLGRVQELESHESPYWEVVQELAKQLGSVERDLSVHRHGMDDDHFTNPPIQPYGEIYEFTPPQPAADTEMRFTKDGDRIWGDKPQPAADDADSQTKWMDINAVLSRMISDRESLWNMSHRVVDLAVEKGLVMRNIDPNDPDLVRVVEERINGAFFDSHGVAKRILSALAVAMGGE